MARPRQAGRHGRAWSRGIPLDSAWLGTCSDAPRRPAMLGTHEPRLVGGGGGHVQVHEVREDVAEVHELLRHADEEGLGGKGAPRPDPGRSPFHTLNLNPSPVRTM